MRSRIGLKALGLCALLIGVMAIGAGSAQAAEWMNENATLVGTPEVLIEKDTEHLKLLTQINGLDIDILCTASQFLGNIKLNTTGLTSKGKVQFTGCTTIELLLNAEKKVIGEHVLSCHLKTGGGAEETIITTEGHGVLGLSKAGVPIVKIVPDNAKETFAEIETSKCVLPELIPVIGHFTVKDCNSLAETEGTRHLIEEEPLESELFVINKTEMEHLSKLDGSVWVKLTDGKKFSGLAG